MSDYAQEPSGKAKSLVANERVRTTAPTKTSTPKPKLARGTRGPAIPPASARTPEAPKKQGLYDAKTGKPFTPPKAMGLDKAVGVVVGVRPSSALKAVEHPLRFAKNNRRKYESSGYRSAPITPTGLIQAVGLSRVGAKADETSKLVKANSLFGGKKPVEEAGAAKVRIAKLPKVQQKAIQVVREGVPIDEKIAAASKQLASSTDKTEMAALKKEISLLRGARRHVVDVNGMPRIDPHNGKLIDLYQSSLNEQPAETLRGTLKGARSVRGKQEAGYSAERSKRVGNASQYLNDSSLSPEERLGLAKNELKGELPKIDFQGMKVLDENSLKALQTHILDHPHLMPFQKIRAAEALSNALAGKVPTNSELTLLEHIFGRDTANGLGQIANHPLKDLILSTLNVPRSLMASFDLSAPFRQGIVTATRHPVIFAKNFKPMIKAFGSERVYQGVLADIHSRPSYPMMLEAKLAITELGKEVGGREERFASDVAEHIPVAGRGVRASGRAYTGFLDKMRADVFDHLLERAKAQGIDVQDEKFLKSLGTYINSATGRGSLGHFQEAGKVLNTFFFSPRLLASRLNFMNPVYYARLDPFARKEALRSAIQLAGTLSTLIGLASQIPGVHVVSDPRNPDWGKIRKGNTRIDIAGGFQQPLRLFAQLATGTAISSTTGKKLNLTANGFGQPTRLDLFLRFFEGKEAPWASFATDFLRNSDQVGNKFQWDKEAYQRMIPLLAQDSYDLYKDRKGGTNGLMAAFAGYGIGAVGFGLQTYGPRTPKPKAPPSSYDPYGGGDSYSGGSDYAQSPSSSGSDYAQP